MASKKELVTKFTKAIREGNAAIFAGAGLSRLSGYVDWQNLLRPLADEIDLDVDKENDLVAVAQYYRNKRGTRGFINQTIVDAFSSDAEINENGDSSRFHELHESCTPLSAFQDMRCPKHV